MVPTHLREVFTTFPALIMSIGPHVVLCLVVVLFLSEGNPMRTMRSQRGGRTSNACTATIVELIALRCGTAVNLHCHETTYMNRHKEAGVATCNYVWIQV